MASWLKRSHLQRVCESQTWLFCLLFAVWQKTRKRLLWLAGSRPGLCVGRAHVFAVELDVFPQLRFGRSCCFQLVQPTWVFKPSIGFNVRSPPLWLFIPTLHQVTDTLQADRQRWTQRYSLVKYNSVNHNEFGICSVCVYGYRYTHKAKVSLQWLDVEE